MISQCILDPLVLGRKTVQRLLFALADEAPMDSCQLGGVMELSLRTD